MLFFFDLSVLVKIQSGEASECLNMQNEVSWLSKKIA